MAIIFMDGFDKYGPTGQTTPTPTSLMTSGEWTSNSSVFTMTVVAPLSATGQAISAIGNAGLAGQLLKTLSTTYSRLIGGFRFNKTMSDSQNSGFSALKAGTKQWSVTVDSNTGTISLRTGSVTGTALATSSASVTTGSTHYIEFDVTVGASASYQVWLDGVSVFSGTGNTRGDGANNNADGVAFGSASAGAFVFDDFYLFDTTGSTNNAVLLTSPRIETTFPSGDNQTQFTNGASIIGTDYSLTGTTNAPGANKIFLRAFTPAVNMTINSVSCMPAATSAGAKFKSVIYPGIVAGSALTTTGNEVVGAASGTALTSAFGSPQSLTGGVTYTIGFITDTSVALTQTDNTGNTGSVAANTYGSGAPATLPAMTTGQPSWQLWGNCTGAAVNWVSENLNPPVGDASYASSSTVSNEDLYTFPALSSVPSNIYAVGVKGYIKKSDAGARTVDLRLKSVSTDSGGSSTGQTPATSYGWLDSYFETDPATGVAFTASGLNAAKSGPKVAS